MKSGPAFTSLRSIHSPNKFIHRRHSNSYWTMLLEMSIAHPRSATEPRQCVSVRYYAAMLMCELLRFDETIFVYKFD
jgi:hypothetical protein